MIFEAVKRKVLRAIGSLAALRTEDATVQELVVLATQVHSLHLMHLEGGGWTLEVVTLPSVLSRRTQGTTIGECLSDMSTRLSAV